MSGTPELRRLQEWLALVVRHPESAAAGIRARVAQGLFPIQDVVVGRVVAPGKRMPVTGCLQVYHTAYRERLCEVLAAEYPALHYLLGKERFRSLCTAYVRRHPSRHPNLNQLGRLLPAFVARQRRLREHAFATDLARLELGISLAFDAPARPVLHPGRLQAVPAETWPRAVLACTPSLQLLALRYPVNEWFDAFAAGQEPGRPRPARTHVAVYRREYRVCRMGLAADAFAVLASIARGVPLGRALARAPQDAVGAWSQAWAAGGLFTDVRIAPR